MNYPNGKPFNGNKSQDGRTHRGKLVKLTMVAEVARKRYRVVEYVLFESWYGCNT